VLHPLLAPIAWCDARLLYAAIQALATAAEDPAQLKVALALADKCKVIEANIPSPQVTSRGQLQNSI